MLWLAATMEILRVMCINKNLIGSNSETVVMNMILLNFSREYFLLPAFTLTNDQSQNFVSSLISRT